jgi:hypothetical protein
MKTIIQEGYEYISMKQIPIPMDKRKSATAIHLTGSLNSVCSIRTPLPPLPPLPRRASAGPVGCHIEIIIAKMDRKLGRQNDQVNEQ